MHKVLLLGAGKIGRAIAAFLHGAGGYEVTVGDTDEQSLRQLQARADVKTARVDATSAASVVDAARGCDSVVSALSYHHNLIVADAAMDIGASYFDLTEDVQTTRGVRLIAKRAKPGQVFVPQCGLAPGFVSIVAAHLAAGFDKLDTVSLRVGALPQFPSNEMKYNLTWSTDGLINEYCNPCEAIHDGRRIEALPLEGLEHFSLDGVHYEAFNTSGGIGTLCESFHGCVRELNYKTVRYLGHRDLMAFLLNELRMSERRVALKEMLERAVPITFQDVVVVFCTVAGWRDGQLVQVSDARKTYPRTIDGLRWSAIQTCTAAGLCAVLDLHAHGRLPSRGFVRQEQVNFDEFMANRFGCEYEPHTGTPFTVGHSRGPAPGGVTP
jgi:saccharopine dehydrogenase-like NADP-dependent oxidoreductase